MVFDGNSTDNLEVLVTEKYLGVDYRLTGPGFFAGNALVDGTYTQIDASGTANTASSPPSVPFATKRISPLVIGDGSAVPEPATWALLGIA